MIYAVKVHSSIGFRYPGVSVLSCAARSHAVGKSPIYGECSTDRINSKPLLRNHKLQMRELGKE